MPRFFCFLIMVVVLTGCGKEKSKVSIKSPVRTAPVLLGDHLVVRNVSGMPDSTVNLNQLSSDIHAMDSSTCAELPEIALQAASATMPSLHLAGSRLGSVSSFRVSTIAEDGRRLRSMGDSQRLKVGEAGAPVIDLGPSLGEVSLLSQPRRLVLTLFSEGKDEDSEQYQGCLLVSTQPVLSPAQIRSEVRYVNGTFDGPVTINAETVLHPVAQVIVHNPNRVEIKAHVFAMSKHITSGSALALWYDITNIQTWRKDMKTASSGSLNVTIAVPPGETRHLSFFGGSKLPDWDVQANRGIEIQWSANARSLDDSTVIANVPTQSLILR